MASSRAWTIVFMSSSRFSFRRMEAEEVLASTVRVTSSSEPETGGEPAAT
jgi:hypothetical protein